MHYQHDVRHDLQDHISVDRCDTTAGRDGVPARRGRRGLAGVVAAAIALGAGGAAIGGPSTQDDGSTEVAVPKVYVVPMRGQMGTDIVKSIYDDVIKDIKRVNPDLVVYEMESFDYNQNYYLPDDDPEEVGVADLDEIRTLAETLKRELIGVRQVMWVHDAVGNSVFLAAAFPDLYMASSARFAGGDGMVRSARRRAPDAQVGAKWTAAVVAYGAGLFELGGYPKEIAEAFMMPERMLSVSFEGRNLKWSLDNAGQWIIDNSDKSAAGMSARTASDIGFAQGMADDLSELMLLLGYREYEVVPDSGKIVERYVEEWRRQMENAAKRMLDYQDAMRYASGRDAARYLGQARQALQDIVNAMRRYPAIETRWRMSRGVTRMALEREIDRITRLLEEARRANQTGGSRGGGGGAGLGGGTGGGGGGRRGR